MYVYVCLTVQMMYAVFDFSLEMGQKDETRCNIQYETEGVDVSLLISLSCTISKI